MRNVIDTPAAQIHRRMLDGEVGALGFEERQRWVWFMLLLLVRHPGMIRPRQKAQEESWKNFFVETLLVGQTPTGHAEPLDRAGAEFFYNQNFAGSGRDVELQGLVNLPLSSPFPNQIMNLEWRVLQLDSAPTYFFPLADNPVSIVGDGPNKGFWMPLAPDALFVAGDSGYFSTTPVLREKFRESLPLRVVHHQFEHTREFVIVKDGGKEQNQALVRIAGRYLPRHAS